MAVWALVIAVGLMIGSAPLLVGLVIVMPVLSHASWHLYRRTVESPKDPRRPNRAHPADKPSQLRG
jgi:uncharacterized membrane protein